MTKPFSQACENNKQPILSAIDHYFSNSQEVLEVGSGTGQHAVYFAEQMPDLIWQTSDQLQYHEGITQWLQEANLPNALLPIELDVTRQWPNKIYQGIFSANTTHIMSWPMVEAFFNGVGEHLEVNGHFCLYGPFNFCGEFTSDSNRQFDASLKSQDEAMGIRDYVDLEELARQSQLVFVEKREMPANNHLLVWQKSINSKISL
ncbi:MAG: DUF938 domain-containing protein [Gammaproteobacteria bacterium]|nr:DUF938 domain-containing protein [Gammaproteobacteria bacterium]